MGLCEEHPVGSTAEQTIDGRTDSPPGMWDRQPLELFNISQQESVDLSPLRIPLDKSLPNCYKSACRHPRLERWLLAMERELTTLPANDTWE